MTDTNRCTTAGPIPHAWISTTGNTGAPNYDEFQSNAKIAELIRARPTSILAVDMPHCSPQMAAMSAGPDESLGYAVERLAQMKREGLFTEYRNLIYLYQIEHPGRGVNQLGIGLMLNPDQIWDPESNPQGLIIRNEDVFVEKVQDRTRHILATQHLISSVALVLPDRDGAFRSLFQEMTRALGQPTVTDQDERRNIHRIWAITEASYQDRLLGWLDGKELIVADGNHRSLASQEAGLKQFLGVVLCAETMTICEYNRVITDLGMSDEEFVSRLNAAGVRSRKTGSAEIFIPEAIHHLGLYMRSGSYELEFTGVDSPDPVMSLDHQLVETVILREVLGLDPGDHKIQYVGGDYPHSYLQGLVDSGRCQCAITVPPVPMDTFIAINAARKKMPRKSTWFTPKARAGLVLAQLD